MGLEKSVKEVVIGLLSKEAMSVDDLADVMEKHPRTVYRLLQSLKKDGYEVIRTGDYGRYFYRVEGKHVG